MRYPRAVGATPVRSWRASLADPGLGDQLVQPPARGRERLGVTPDLIPGITIALEPPGHLVDGPAVRAGGGVVELIPVQRRRDRRIRSGADRVRRHRGVGVGVALDVDQDLALPLRLALLVGEQTGLPPGGQPGPAAREL